MDAEQKQIESKRMVFIYMCFLFFILVFITPKLLQSENFLTIVTGVILQAAFLCAVYFEYKSFKLWGKINDELANVSGLYSEYNGSWYQNEIRKDNKGKKKRATSERVSQGKEQYVKRDLM
jgi:hypothetical protein